MDTLSLAIRLCKVCRVEKSEREFYRHNRQYGHLRRSCKECDKREKAEKYRSAKVHAPEGQKHCERCNRIKPVNSFLKRKATLDGYQQMCRECFTGAPDGFLKCKRCRQTKPEDQFYRRKGVLTGRSRKCTECTKVLSAEWLSKNREHCRARDREYYHNNKAMFRESLLRSKYGIGIAEYEQMLEQQSGVCAICEQPQSDPRYEALAVDHCHATGRIRGLLCNLCNKSLGGFKDSPERLRRAAEYLESAFASDPTPASPGSVYFRVGGSLG